MSQKSRLPAGRVTLRHKAERKAAELDEPPPPKGSVKEAQRLLYELQVHQIELEAQNDELRRVQKALEESRQRYFDLYDLAPVGYVTISEKGLIQEANLTAAHLLGVARGVLAKQPFSRFIEAQSQDIYYLHHKKLLETGQAHSCELRIHRKDAEPFWAQIDSTVALSPDGTRVCRAVVSDISARMRLTQEMMEAKVEADRANRAKSEFLANMSHEIRTPLNGVMGMAELALSEDINPTVHEYLQIAKHSGKALLEIINDILDLSKIEAGKIALVNKPFLLREGLESCFNIFLANARDKGLLFYHSIGLEVPDRLIGDSGRLRQVLINLIGNAVKFTESGAVRLSVAVDDQPAAPGSIRLNFRIKDDGIGIAKDRLEEVFEAFSQGGLTNQANFGGTGLGLTISKSLVEMMGGRIWADSKFGKGSTFYFTATFGLSEERSMPATDTQPSSSPLPGTLHILLAEDNRINQIIAVALLGKRGHQVELAENGREALQKLSVGNFDLVLMDVRMPDMDGTETVKAIRRGEAGQDKVGIMVVAMTAHALRGDRERFMSVGMDDYLTKPIIMEELDRILASALAKKDGGEPQKP